MSSKHLACIEGFLFDHQCQKTAFYQPIHDHFPAVTPTVYEDRKQLKTVSTNTHGSIDAKMNQKG